MDAFGWPMAPTPDIVKPLFRIVRFSHGETMLMLRSLARKVHPSTSTGPERTPGLVVFSPLAW